MPINSKKKGKNYELEVCKNLKDLGYSDVKRSVQYCGNNTDSNNADVIGLDGIHIECKHYNSTAFKYEWLEQAVRDSNNSANLPAVFHRINNEKTVVTMRIEDWIKLYDEYYKNLHKNYRLQILYERRQALLSVFFLRTRLTPPLRL